MRLLFTCCFVGLNTFAFAVAPGTAADGNTSDFDFVGRIGGASGVLVGPNMVLTARHVGAGSFTLPGYGTFSVVAGSIRSHPTDDLMLFRIDTGSIALNNYAEINVNRLSTTTAVTMVGYGDTAVVNGAGTGYVPIGANGVRRKASGFVEGTVFVDEPGLRAHSLYAPLRANGQAALLGGDSGGGWFLEGTSGRPQLVGTNSWIGTFGTFTGNWMFSNDSNNFFASGAVNLSGYNEWLVTNGASVVPEPATIIAVTAGLAFLSRRRRHQIA